MDVEMDLGDSEKPKEQKRYTLTRAERAARSAFRKELKRLNPKERRARVEQNKVERQERKAKIRRDDQALAALTSSMKGMSMNSKGKKKRKRSKKAKKNAERDDKQAGAGVPGENEPMQEDLQGMNSMLAEKLKF